MRGLALPVRTRVVDQGQAPDSLPEVQGPDVGPRRRVMMRGPEIVDGLLAGWHETDAQALKDNPRTERFDDLMRKANTLMGLDAEDLEGRSGLLHRNAVLLTPRCDPEVAARAVWDFVSMGLGPTDAINCALREAQLRAKLAPGVG